MLKARLETEKTDRLLSFFSKLGLHPHWWSLLAAVLAAAGFLSLASHKLAAGLIFFALSGFMDMIDGAVARATNSSTKAGAFVDGVLDRYVELFLALGLLFYLEPDTWLVLPIQVWIILMVYGSVMTSFVRAYADHRGLVKDPQHLKQMGGFLERGERLSLLLLGMLLGIFDQRWLAWAIVLVAVLSNATAIQRIFIALRQFKRAP